MIDVSYGDNAPDEVNLIIEIQKGGMNKYEFDKDTGRLFLDRVGGVHMGYPADYGYVPDTLCDDGDPLDGLLVVDEPVVHGAVVKVRAIGVLNMIDGGERDEKLICVPVDDISKSHFSEVEDLGPEFKKQVEHYYSHYKDWKKDWNGADVKFEGWGDSSSAKQVILDSIEAAKEQQ